MYTKSLWIPYMIVVALFWTLVLLPLKGDKGLSPLKMGGPPFALQKTTLKRQHRFGPLLLLLLGCWAVEGCWAVVLLLGCWAVEPHPRPRLLEFPFNHQNNESCAKTRGSGARQALVSEDVCLKGLELRLGPTDRNDGGWRRAECPSDHCSKRSNHVSNQREIF